MFSWWNSFKVSILFCKFLHENKVYRKNGVHHDEASGKSFETVISDFIFLKLCHRDFSPQSNVKNHNFIKKLVQFRHFFWTPRKTIISLTYCPNMGLDYVHQFLSKYFLVSVMPRTSSKKWHIFRPICILMKSNNMKKIVECLKFNVNFFMHMAVEE